MNERDIQQNIQERVLARVAGIRMHSRAYFVIRALVTLFVTLLTLLLSAFILSFIAFSIHASGEDLLLGFGGGGIGAFLRLFPWGALIVDLGALVLLEWLLQGFKFGYRFSLLSVFVGVFAASAVLAAFVDLTPIHPMMLQRADRGELPVIGELYEGVRGSHQDQGVFRGTIISMQTGSIVITHDDADHDPDDGTWTVVVPANAPALHVGERVYVFGTLSGQVIQAQGIQQLSSDQ